MVEVILSDGSDFTVDVSEVKRYLGIFGGTDEATESLVGKAIAEVSCCLDCKACFERLPLTFSGTDRLTAGSMSIVSADLFRHLYGCESAYIFAATVGHGVDRLIRKYSAVSPSHAVAVQAAGAAAVEAFCDFVCGRLSLLESGKLLPRFSPGYGDYPLSAQTDIFQILDCRRRIGVTLTENLMMVPGKSVSAVIGIKG